MSLFDSETPAEEVETTQILTVYQRPYATHRDINADSRKIITASKVGLHRRTYIPRELAKLKPARSRLRGNKHCRGTVSWLRASCVLVSVRLSFALVRGGALLSRFPVTCNEIPEPPIREPDALGLATRTRTKGCREVRSTENASTQVENAPRQPRNRP